MRKLRTLKVEDDIEEVLEAVLVVEPEDKKRKNNPVNKIGTEEDEVHGEKVNQATQMLSALSVASMAIMQRTVTQASLSVVVSPNILPKIVNLKVDQPHKRC